MKKKIGIVGLKPSEISLLKKKYKKFQFLNVNDSNFFSEGILSINALVVLYEYPVKKNLSVFLRKKHKEFKKLEWLHLTRAGIDECEPFIKDYNFKFTAGKKIQGPNVSEHCLSLLLALTRGLFDQFNEKKYSFRPTEIKEKKIIIAGFGGIGKEIAIKLKAFGCIISSIDHSKISKKLVEKNYSLNQISKIIKNYDILINALPLTKKTKKIFDKKVFKNMKNNSIFVSVSRDQTINIKDLNFFIKKKKFLGIAIDNTGSFKMKKKVVYDKKHNFILSDHLAGVTTNNDRRIKLIYDNIESYVSKKKIKFEVSKIKGY
jgi:phosphoglycerate dehydrogenase-like enzyme